jgi:indolepyruvate ferredoxin oxidoreductase
MPTSTRLTEAAARNLFKLMAYKDEYEVARLYTSGEFEEKLRAQFGGKFTLSFHLAPPLFARKDLVTGELRKMRFGPWMLPAFRLLAKLSGLRGTRFDIFGCTQERRAERRLIGEYEAVLEEVALDLTVERHEASVALASYPDSIRGFGHIKEGNMMRAQARRDEMLAAFGGTETKLFEAAE